jgi:preprotein translocase subunit YajC
LSTYSFQPSAPGQQAQGPAAPPPPTTGTQQPDGPAQGQQQSLPMMSLLIMALPILLIFMTMRGQTKKQRQVESSLKTGDTVITQSGLIGKVTEMIGETRVKVDGGDVKTNADAKDKPQEKKA